ncbi:MAG: InlB B-repeat-containing protein [Acetatifactor sp.]|nr:InlB B-repeat-containing protein [Acetatifactor sp.]MDE7354991.1 InlB B-repeat-containing protein [Acetatifactor sp.]
MDYGASCLSPKTFTPAKSGWIFVGWRSDTALNPDVYKSLTMGDNPVTLYAIFQQTITVTYYNGSTAASSATGKRFYNNGKVANPSFTLNQAALFGWTARGWSASGTANSGITYNNGAAFTRDSNVTLFGMYQQTITLTLYNGSSSAANQSGTRYHCPGSGSTVNPAFTVTPAALSGWSFNGWAVSSGATAAIAYSSISNTAFSANTTLYGRYSQPITLSYNGNGASGGSTAAQTGTRYFNSGNYSNPSFTLRANGFTRTDYNWSKWALGSAGGTQYANGATVTLGANTVFYAVWAAIPAVPFYLSSKNLSYSYTEYLSKAGGYRPSASLPYWYLEKIHGGGGTTAYSWAQDKSSSFCRQHCTKVKFRSFRTDGDLIIGNKVIPLEYKPYDEDPMVVDISDQSDMISCTLKTYITGARAEMQIFDPYFY